VNRFARRPCDRAGRIERAVRPQRNAEEQHERSQQERAQIELQASVFKHSLCRATRLSKLVRDKRFADNRAGRRERLPHAGLTD